MRECRICGRSEADLRFHHKERLCVDCKSDLDREYRRKNADRLREKRRQKYLRNREASLARSRAWAKANPEARRAIGRRYYHAHAEKFQQHREENRERQAAYRRSWYERNREAAIQRTKDWSRENAEAKRAYNREWYAKNLGRAREYFRIQAHRRRGVRLDEYYVAYAMTLLGDPCSYCGEPASEIDHIDPLVRNDRDGWENLTAACRRCNARKHAKPLLVFLVQRAA